MKETGHLQRKRKFRTDDKGIKDYLLIIKVESKKVAVMVATFLSEGDNGFQLSTKKVESEKVTNMVGTFFDRQYIVLFIVIL